MHALNDTPTVQASSAHPRCNNSAQPGLSGVTTLRSENTHATPAAVCRCKRPTVSRWLRRQRLLELQSRRAWHPQCLQVCDTSQRDILVAPRIAATLRKKEGCDGCSRPLK